jgi:PAS domain S-box-containing protein
VSSTESLSEALSETLELFTSRRESHAPLTTSEVTDSLDCACREASDRLERLVELGHLETKQVGDREHVWWLSEALGETGRDESERTPTTSEDAPARLMENVPGMVYRCRNERGWPMEFVSEGCRGVTGYAPEALERGDVSYGDDLVVEADRDELWKEVQSAVNDGEQFLVTYRIETASGDVRWVRERGRGVFDDEGELELLEGVTIDVTERKRLETELEEMFGRISDAFYALDDQWRFTHANERAEELIDYQGEGLVGENFWEVFEWATDSKLGEKYREAMETQEPTTFEFYYPEPLDAWYEIHAYPSETGLSVYFRDVTERKERERELERSERRYRALVENFPNGAVALVDEDLRYRTVGGDPLDVADVTSGEIEGSHVREAIPDALADELLPRYEAALDGESDSFEAEYDGRIFEFQVVPVRDDDGNVFAALGFSWDVTARKESQRKLRQSERRYRTLVENFPNGAVALFDENLRYTVTGGQILGNLDISKEEVVGADIWDRYPEELAAKLEPKFRAALDGETNSFELEFHDRHWLAHTLPVSDDEGDVFAGMLMVQDVTEQKERERYLRDAKSRLEAATEAGAVGTWEWYIPEDQMVTGATFARTFGVDPEAAQEGVSLDRFVSAIHEDDRERVEHKIEEAIETCGEYEAEYRVWNADDELRWVVARGHVECDEAGNPVTFPGALTDITERKRAEQELEEHRKQLETLFEVLPVGVVVADEDGHLVEANETAKEIWGGDVFDAENVTDYERYQGWWADTGEPVESKKWTMARVLGGEEVTEPDVFEIERADGEHRTIMVHGMPVRDASGKVTRGVVTQTDVTERREYQRQLEESERRYRTLAENFPNGAVGVYDHDLRYTLAAGEKVGDPLPSAEELEGTRMPEQYPDDVAADLEPMFRAAIEEGETGSAQTTVAGRDWQAWATPLRDADGEIFAGLSFTQDITEQVEREQKLEESNDRLESFASMLAHELRNPVTIGQIYSQQLPAETDSEADGSGSEAVEYVTEAFDRIEDMIDVMLVLTRGHEAVGDSSPLTLADVTRDAWAEIDAPDATLEVEADIVMRADETYVRHMFRNLFENAVEHGSTSPRSQAHEDATQHGGADVTVRVGELPTGFYVADDGPGIPPEERDAVFEAGYTTAADKGGTGLGLAFVEELAEVYGWDCEVTESESGGAQFEFRNVDSITET